MCTQLAAKLFRKTNTNQNSTDLQPPAVSPPELSDFIFFTSFTSKPNLFYLLPKVVAENSGWHDTVLSADKSGDCGEVGGA